MGNIGNLSGIGKMESSQGGAGDAFIKLTVDLTDITPTTETYKGKTYNKFTFTVNELTISSISPLGDVESIAINDALIYNLLPMSNSNDDMGIHVEYSNNTFTGYVLSTMSTLTEVNFMFTYYLELTKTSILCENYTDMVSQNKLYKINVTDGYRSSYVFYSSIAINNSTQLKSYLKSKNNGTRIFARLEGNASQTRYYVSSPYFMQHYDETNIQISCDDIYANFSSGSYTGGGKEIRVYRLPYANLNVSSSEE